MVKPDDKPIKIGIFVKNCKLFGDSYQNVLDQNLLPEFAGLNIPQDEWICLGVGDALEINAEIKRYGFIDLYEIFNGYSDEINLDITRVTQKTVNAAAANRRFRGVAAAYNVQNPAAAGGQPAPININKRECAFMLPNFLLLPILCKIFQKSKLYAEFPEVYTIDIQMALQDMIFQKLIKEFE